MKKYNFQTSFCFIYFKKLFLLTQLKMLFVFENKNLFL